MNRNELWQKLKASGITQSNRLDCPPDADLAIVIRHSPVSSKALIDFICALDQRDTRPSRGPENNLLGP